MNRMTIVSPLSIAGDYPAVFQPWSTKLTSVIQAPVLSPMLNKPIALF